MNMVLIKQKTGRDAPLVVLRDYLSRIGQIVSDSNANLIIGPEFSLSYFSNPLTKDSFEKEALKLVPNLKRDQLIIPGTGIFLDYGKKQMTNSAPIISREGIFYIDKKTSSDEDSGAEKYGYEYVRGKKQKSLFKFSNMKLALDICRDYGTMQLGNFGVIDRDLHLILASNHGVVDTGPAIVVDKGIVALVDGFGPQVHAYKMEGDVFRESVGKNTSDYLLIRF